MISDKDEVWPLHHSPSQSSHGHGRQDSNEKIGMYGSIAPSLPPPPPALPSLPPVPASSSSGSIRRNLTMTSSHSNGNMGMGSGLNRADSMASSAHGGTARSEAGGYQQQPYQGFYHHGIPSHHMPVAPPQVGQAYGGGNNASYYEHPQQGYAAQYQQQQHGGLDYSNSMRRPGGYEY